MAARGALTSARRALTDVVAGTASRLRPGAEERSPGDRSVLDDVATRRPWNVVVKLARARARRRIARLRDGLTVVIVSWNTAEVLSDVLTVIGAMTPEDVELLVVDNGSSDGTRDALRSFPGVRVLALPANAGHGVALDLAVCAARTRTVVTLDSDAVPLVPGWLVPAAEPVQTGRAALAGLRATRGFVHPVYLAVDVATFVEERLSFQVHRADRGEDTVWGCNAWDTGELMTERVGPARIEFVEPTTNQVEGLPGMTAGGVVYHHGGVTRGPGGGAAVGSWRAACRALGLAPILEQRWEENPI